MPDGGAEDVARAIDAASAALPAWRALPGIERSKKLRTLYDLMNRDQDRLAALMTSEQGKPLAEARGEVEYAASFLEWFAGEAERIYGADRAGDEPANRVLVLRQPVGVTAAITPWNFPAAMMTRKLGPCAGRRLHEHRQAGERDAAHAPR